MGKVLEEARFAVCPGIVEHNGHKRVASTGKMASVKSSKCWCGDDCPFEDTNKPSYHCLYCGRFAHIEVPKDDGGEGSRTGGFLTRRYYNVDENKVKIEQVREVHPTCFDKIHMEGRKKLSEVLEKLFLTEYHKRLGDEARGVNDAVRFLEGDFDANQTEDDSGH